MTLDPLKRPLASHLVGVSSSPGNRAAQSIPPRDGQQQRTPLRLGIISKVEIVVAGLGVMLRPHRDRIVLVDRASRDEPADVCLIGPLLDDAGSIKVPLRIDPDACLVAFGFDDSPARRHQARSLGAGEYVSLAGGATGLISALETARQRHAGSPRAATPTDLFDGNALSPRELQVLTLICRGLSNDDIAKELILSINSVKSYIRSAYRKIGVDRRAQAVIWGIEKDL
jgi:NarL family two-component system response regulator LiaR